MTEDSQSTGQSLAPAVVAVACFAAVLLLFSGCATRQHQRFNRVENRIADEHSAAAVHAHEEALHAVHVRGIHSLSMGEVGAVGVLQGRNGDQLYSRRFNLGARSVGSFSGMSAGSRAVMVRPGDTVSSILRRYYGVASPGLVSQTRGLNPGVNVNRIVPGQVLTLP